MKMKIEDAFFDSLEKLKGIKPNDRILLLLSTYMGIFDRKEKLPYLSRKGRLKQAIKLCTADMYKFTNFMSPQIRNDEIRIWYDKQNASIFRRKKRPCKEIFGRDAQKEDEEVCSKLCPIDRERPEDY
jgi:hypothetical protein